MRPTPRTSPPTAGRGPLALVLALLGCAGEPVDPPADDAFDLACPGDPSCPTASGALLAGAAAVSIEPPCYESWDDVDANGEYDDRDDRFFDCGCDRRCPGDPGWTAADAGEADGVFQAIWMAGFGTGRAARGVRPPEIGLDGVGDGLFARAIVIEQGETTLALVGLDLVGYFRDDVQVVREKLAERGVDVDLVIISSTHTHEGPDTMGAWGRDIVTRGYDAAYKAWLHDTIAGAIADAAADRVPVTMTVAEADLSVRDPETGVLNWISDTRDPWVIDPILNVARFADAENQTVATLLNWANHPEALSDENTWLTSDFVHGVRRAVEHGTGWASGGRAGVGGVAIYLSGAVGGMMTPLRITAKDGDGNLYPNASFEKADAIGLTLGDAALDALSAASPVSAPSLAFRQRTFTAPVENLQIQTSFLLKTFDRSAAYDTNEPLDDDNVPLVTSEMCAVSLGPIHMLTMPGELLPELWIGGYDGSHVHAPGRSVVHADNPNPPDLSLAPSGPYLRDRLGGEHRWLIGLANDELGYFIPSYNFELAERGAWFFEAEGHHYEETYALNPNMEQILLDAAAPLLDAMNPP